jgi:hypothetical protein
LSDAAPAAPGPTAGTGVAEKASSRFAASLFVTRKSFWPLAILLAALVLASIPTLSWLVGGFAAGALARLIARRERRVDGALDIVDDALRFNGERLCERAGIKTALLIRRRRRKPILRLERRSGRPLRFEIGGAQEGRALIRALGLDPRQTVTTFSLPAMNQRARAAAFAGAATVGLVVLVAMPLLGSLLPGVGVALAIAFYAAFVLLTRTTLHIGADGLRIQSLGRTRFVPHGEIERVVPCKGPHTGVDVILRSGDVVRLPTATHAEGDGGLASGITDLIDGARTGPSEDVAREKAMLARRGRDAAEWLRTMRAMAMGANADHRTAPIVPARVWQVLEDPSAETSARVGAAALLATTASEAERTRLRVAAQAITAPQVRVAIDALVSGEDDDAVLEALDAVHGAAEAPPRRARRDRAR